MPVACLVYLDLFLPVLVILWDYISQFPLLSSFWVGLANGRHWWEAWDRKEEIRVFSCFLQPEVSLAMDASPLWIHHPAGNLDFWVPATHSLFFPQPQEWFWLSVLLWIAHFCSSITSIILYVKFSLLRGSYFPWKFLAEEKLFYGKDFK
jgi:hypothetical protein